MADVIHPITDVWDEQLVMDHFDPTDAKAFLSISICVGTKENMAWHFDPKGAFSMKYARS